jgi:pimeloyl-ACP methyl ester carboxylesterase
MIGHSIHGKGARRVLVLHGWFGDSSVFKPMKPALDPDVFTIVFMDYRGYGASRSLPGPYNLETIVEDANALVDSLGWDRFSVVGHSMGAKAALRLALRLGERVEKILALTPVWAGAAPFDPETLSLFRNATANLSYREVIICNSVGNQLPQVWTRDLAKFSSEVSTSQAFSDYFESWATDDFAAETRSLQQEVLVIAGENDAALPPDAVRSAWLSSLHRVSVQVLPGSGHYPMAERPLALASIFEKFLIPPRKA